MTEAARIRWTEQYPGTIYGHPGTLASWGFELWLSDGHGDFAAGEWVLTVPFIFGDRLNMNGRYKLSGRDPEKLKADAERLLAKFVASIGAVFGDAVAADLRSRAEDLAAAVDRRPGAERDKLLFAAGLKRAADLVEYGDQPMANVAVPEPRTDADQ